LSTNKGGQINFRVI